LTSQFEDGGHDVISRRKVLPSGECSRSVCTAHMQQRPAVSDLSTFVLANIKLSYRLNINRVISVCC